MNRYALLACIALVLSCSGCGSTTLAAIQHKVVPSDEIYGMISLHEMPVGYVIQETDVMTTQLGWSHRELLHPFTPRPDTGEFTTDRSRIVGHMVKTFIRDHQAVSPRRDLD